MPQVLPMTRVEAYLAYKAGVISEADLKPSLKTNFYSGLEHWLAFWCGLCDDYPVDENNDPKWYTEEEYYVAYLCGIAPDYPYNCYRRVGAYLRHIISLAWPEPERPLTREEYYLSLIESTYKSSGDPSSNITIDRTAQAPFKDLKIYGDAVQDGDPTPDAPIPIQVVTGEQTVKVTGKNLLGLTSGANITSNGVKSVWNGNEVTITDEASSIQVFLSQYVPNSLPAGDYVLSVKNAFHAPINRIIFRTFGADNTTLNSYQITAGSTSVAVHIDGTEAKYRFVMLATNGATYNHTVSFQLEKGSTATDYQPYQGQTYPISLGSLELAKIGDYQDYIRKSTGKNLFDKDNANTLNAYFTTATTTITAPQVGDVETIVFIPCNPSTTYTVSKKAGSVFTIGTTDVLPVIGTQVNNIVGDNSATHLTVTTDSDSKFLVARVYRSNTDTITQQEMLDSVQIELGPTATEYEPYGEVWYKHKAVAKSVFDGSEDEGWQLQNSGTPNWYFRVLAGFVPAPGRDTTVLLCSQAMATQVTNANTNQGIWVLAGGLVRMRNSSETTVAQWETHLSQVPMVLYSPLAAATDEEITDTALVAQLEALVAGGSYDPQTNIVVTATDPNLPGLLQVQVAQGK